MFCREKGIDPISAPLDQPIEFLTKIFESGVGCSSVRQDQVWQDQLWQDHRQDQLWQDQDQVWQDQLWQDHRQDQLCHMYSSWEMVHSLENIPLLNPLFNGS